MKSGIRQVLLLLLLLAVGAGLIAGCGTMPTATEKGGMNLVATLVPSKGVLGGITVTSVEAVLTKAGSAAVRVTATPVNGQATLTASNLAVGTWAIDIKAYYSDGGTQYVAFSGSDSVVVQANTTTTKAITLPPQTGGAVIQLTVPTGTGAAGATVSLIDPSDPANVRTQSFDPSAGTASVTFANLKATTMTVRVALKDATGQTLTSSEAPIDIWPGQAKQYAVQFGTSGNLMVSIITEAEPKAPKNLAWVASGGKVKVTWAANTESDLAGYAVYRSDGTSPDKRLLTDALVTVTEFTDQGSTATGTYTYWVQAYNKKGLSSPFSAALPVNGTTPPPPPPTGKLYSLLVGVGDYPGSSSDLTGPPLDVAAMKNSLTVGNAGSDVPTTLTNAQATKAGIKAAVDAIKAKATSSDAILFYYTGHGLDGTGTNYEDESICPYDTLTTTGSINYANLITDNELQSWFSTSPTQNVVFIFDSCYSGGMVKGMVNGVEVTRRFVTLTEFAKDLNVAGYTVMMASDKREYSYDSSTGGIYTKFLVQGMDTKAGDTNSDKSVMPEEVHNWLKPQVASATGNQQNPTFYKGASAQPVPLYRY